MYRNNEMKRVRRLHRRRPVRSRFTNHPLGVGEWDRYDEVEADHRLVQHAGAGLDRIAADDQWALGNAYLAGYEVGRLLGTDPDFAPAHEDDGVAIAMAALGISAGKLAWRTGLHDGVADARTEP